MVISSPLHQETVFSLEVIRSTASELVRQNRLDRQQPIYTLCQFIPARQWLAVERELEMHDYLLRDHIIDLMNCEAWDFQDSDGYGCA
ncbi:DUF4327 family protein [Synechocystis sp. LEGE 06083]|uniref:DUF4327 family protein n=1 Tax=Synechocystis sp. LEGE 06083 TaxID=915336 RepID=UPI00187F6541|nr:DUF4327 family protein [Synechocystis sp. LEGE 06083]MBE9195012.1 DUF4327 family protein [Synechocystis sp. LEGE 06083]